MFFFACDVKGAFPIARTFLLSQAIFEGAKKAENTKKQKKRNKVNGIFWNFHFNRTFIFEFKDSELSRFEHRLIGQRWCALDTHDPEPGRPAAPFAQLLSVLCRTFLRRVAMAGSQGGKRLTRPL